MRNLLFRLIPNMAILSEQSALQHFICQRAVQQLLRFTCLQCVTAVCSLAYKCAPNAGAFFTFFTGPIAKIGGRKLVMICGGASFCVGAILCAFAQDLAMLIIGRVCLGAGVGFANQVRLLLCPVAARMMHAICVGSHSSCSCTAVLHSMNCELALSCGACCETWLSHGCLCICAAFHAPLTFCCLACDTALAAGTDVVFLRPSVFCVKQICGLYCRLCLCTYQRLPPPMPVVPSTLCSRWPPPSVSGLPSGSTTAPRTCTPTAGVCLLVWPLCLP